MGDGGTLSAPSGGRMQQHNLHPHPLFVSARVPALYYFFMRVHVPLRADLEPVRRNVPPQVRAQCRVFAAAEGRPPSISCVFRQR